jgi:hypothetical protein
MRPGGLPKQSAGQRANPDGGHSGQQQLKSWPHRPGGLARFAGAVRALSCGAVSAHLTVAVLAWDVDGGVPHLEQCGRIGSRLDSLMTDSPPRGQSLSPIEGSVAFWPGAPAGRTAWGRFRPFQQADIRTLPDFNEALSAAP